MVGTDRVSGSAIGAVAARADSSIWIVFAWLSTSFRSRSISALLSMSKSLPLGGGLFAGFLPGGPRKRGEETVTLGDYKEIQKGS
jgi:hypothetical protein